MIFSIVCFRADQTIGRMIFANVLEMEESFLSKNAAVC